MDYYTYWKESLCKNLSRDKIMIDVLNKFEKKPIKVFELGTSRDISPQARYGDGWSSLFWAEYIKDNGGSLLTCDISEQSINNAKTLLSSFTTIDVTYIVEDGFKLLKQNNDYDLICLDGSDDPNEMLLQLRECDLNRSYVLCDDFNSKGVLASVEYPNHILYRLENNHQMALFGHDIIYNLVNI